MNMLRASVVGKRLLYLAVMLLCGSCCTQAQTAVYGAFSASNFNVPHVGWQYGTTFGLYYDPWGVPFVRAGLDARASFLGSGNAKLDSGLVGPRLQLHPHIIPLMPYAEVLIGGGHVTVGQGLAQTDQTGFEYQFVGGVDMTVLPRLDWRVAEYSWGLVSNLNQSVQPSTVSTGLVLRLP